MKYQLGILGLGKMGSSILSGIIKSKIYQKEEILLFDVNDEIKKKYTELGYIFSDNEQTLIDNVEMLILAIKPQMFKVLNNLKIKDDLVVISIAAGKTIKDLEEIFGKQQFIRVMPNTPSLISYGATAITKSENVLEETFKKAKNIFSSIGIVEEIDESLMNEIIPVNGSMPAFLYYFVEAYIDDATSYGIPYETAKHLACEAVIGSAKMILETGKPIEELINDVCSPGGATLEGLRVLKENNFQEIIKKSNKACIKRAYELSNK
jgi:pyrroline-5-carboxylate reductase